MLSSPKGFPVCAGGIPPTRPGSARPTVGIMSSAATARVRAVLAPSSTLEELMQEIERYLAAVALFRALGHEPRWRGENWSRQSPTKRAQSGRRVDR